MKKVTPIMPSTESIANASTMANESVMKLRVIGLMQSFCFLLIIIGLIVGTIYIMKSKKTKVKRILIGSIIILIPFIINWILNLVKLNMLLNM